MSRRSVQPCRTPHCAARTTGGYCPTCRHRRERRRGSASARGYTRQWQNARRAYLAEHPLCVRCLGLATVVEHVVPHRGNVDLFWDEGNWQALCKLCHDRKTLQEGA